ncbi:hypothetical protein BH11CYA1_BH11CYA1_29660 [soil metagenome]
MSFKILLLAASAIIIFMAIQWNSMQQSTWLVAPAKITKVEKGFNGNYVEWQFDKNGTTNTGHEFIAKWAPSCPTVGQSISVKFSKNYAGYSEAPELKKLNSSSIIVPISVVAVIVLFELIRRRNRPKQIAT